MSKNSTYVFNSEYDTLLIEQVEEVLAKHDIDLEYVISEFLHKIARDKEIPFKLKEPNAETIAAMKEAMDPELIKNAKRYNSFEEIIEELNAL